MHSNRHARLYLLPTLKLLTGCCLSVVLCLWLVPTQARATSVASPEGKIILEVDMGFDTKYRYNYWTPVQVGLTNNSDADFHGTISVRTIAERDQPEVSSQPSPWDTRQAITLAKGAQQQLTLYIPYHLSNIIPQGVIANLFNSQGKIVASQTATSVLDAKPGVFLIGTLTEQHANYFSPLNSVFTNQITSTQLAQLDASSFPAMEAELENFDIIVLDDFSSNTFSSNQLLALQNWVNHGGVLVEVGGPQWQRTIGPLPKELVPVTITGTTTLPAGTQFLSLNSPLIMGEYESPLADPISNDVTASISTIRTQQAFTGTETLLASGPNPLLVESHQGQGVVCYLAVDLAGPDFATWLGANALWTMLLYHAQGDKVLISPAAQGYHTGPGQLLTHLGILDMVEPEMLLGPAILLFLLVGYALLLGPARLLLVKRLKRPYWWSWRIILALIVVFSLASYELAGYQRSASITDNSISMIQVNQGGTAAHITTYSGVFVPGAGDFTLHVPGNSLIQPVANQDLYNDTDAAKRRDTAASMTSGAHESSLTLQGLDPWTLHYAVTEQDIQLHGGINAHISLGNNHLIATVANTLTTPLSDLYLLLPHTFIPVGRLASGETRSIDLPLSSLSFQPSKTLADQIITSNGLPAGYFPYTSDGRPQSTLQRHMALLSALNGAGFTNPNCGGPCSTRAVITGDSLFVTGGHVPNPNLNDYEPLLLPGSQATLIGWADQPATDDVTINGWHPGGQHDSFLQMPVALNLESPSQVPANLIQGHEIDLQSYQAELTLSGIYTLDDGIIIFELPVPTTHYLPIKSFTITVPDLWANPFGPGTGTTNSSHLQALLYNWQNGNWDPVLLTQDGTFSSTATQTYLGPGEQMLLQVTNQNESLGKLYFGKPSLSLD